MEELNLRDNNIEDLGAQALASALVNNTALDKLSLDKNKIYELGAQSIAAALHNNSTLKNSVLRITISAI